MIPTSLLKLCFALAVLLIGSFVAYMAIGILYFLLPAWVFWPLAIVVAIILLLGLYEQFARK